MYTMKKNSGYSIGILCLYLSSVVYSGLPTMENHLKSIDDEIKLKRSPRSRVGKKICQAITIGNNVAMFSQLQGCVVIEGYLRILLIDKAVSDDFQHLHFPDLVEVTEYVLLYRVYGLKSLRNIFPNLSVIRGVNLFYNYALVSYEMPELEELGLYSLRAILRGAVRLENNPNLCYVDTIDWNIITSKSVSMEDHIFRNNRDNDECVNICPANCPIRRISGELKRDVCWTSDNCQSECSNCPTGYCNKETCCHEQCVGGCYGEEPYECFACKNVYYDGRCYSRCPPVTYELQGVRCLIDKECKDYTDKSWYNWKLLEEPKRQCVKECPSGYINDPVIDWKCNKCDKKCPKVCSAAKIVNIADAQKLKGCTIIEGALDIQIIGGKNIAEELEESLGLIEEVNYYIKIARSFALISLNFLKSLRKIHGRSLENGRYSLFVIDNQNLQDIWDFNTHPRLQIAPGSSVLFQLNRKLCPGKIDQLLEQLSLKKNTTQEDVSSNGDLVSCNMKELDLKIKDALSDVALITWTKYSLPDQRQLLGYVVHYREAPERNITIFSDRDACGTAVWKTKDVQNGGNKDEKAILDLLKPWTQYAVYVETYTTANANEGAMSPLVYFKTAPDIPFPPVDVNVHALQQRELRVTWKPPTKPNGNVTHYYVYWAKRPLKTTEYDKRNYCIHKLRISTGKSKVRVSEGIPKVNKTTSASKCEPEKNEMPPDESEAQFAIVFQNYLQTNIYVKRPVMSANSTGQKRSRRSSLDIGLSSNSTLNDGENKTVHLKTKEPEKYSAAIVYSQKIILSNLLHFQEYSIEVIACQEYDPDPKRDVKHCSNRAIISATTLADPQADTIDPHNITATNHTSVLQAVFIRWNDVKNPNGLILNFEIEFTRLAIKNIVPRHVCVQHKEFRKHHGYLERNLESGKYRYRIRAISLAGNGSWTPDKFFFVLSLPGSYGSVSQELVVAVASSCAVLLVIGVIVGVVVCYIAKKKYTQRVPGILYSSVNPDYWVYVADEWEVDRDNIQLLDELGQGSFGMVYEGIVYNLKEEKSATKVAVKTVNDNATMHERNEFLIEASVMKAFNCNHVVKLLGVCSQGLERTLVIMELMPNGDLKNFLRIHRPDQEDNNGCQPPTLKQILQMAGEIADGMAYLAAKKFVHRDLAARNCMVADNLTCKIGDFGMTRDVYETDYYKKGGKGPLPVRWMAPESLKDGVFTSQSDVWSYGVVLWEMATLAAQPYQGLTNEQVLKYVIEGGLMDKPDGCPDKLYSLMSVAWKTNPKQRHTFNQIVEYLIPDLNETFVTKSYFFSTDNQQEIQKTNQVNKGTISPDYIDERDLVLNVNESTPLNSPSHMGSISTEDKNNLKNAPSLDDIVIVSDNQKPNGQTNQVEKQTPPMQNCSRDNKQDENCSCSHEANGVKSSHKNNTNSQLPHSNSNHESGLSSDSSKGSIKSSHSHLNGLLNNHLKTTEC